MFLLLYNIEIKALNFFLILFIFIILLFIKNVNKLQFIYIYYILCLKYIFFEQNIVYKKLI